MGEQSAGVLDTEPRAEETTTAEPASRIRERFPTRRTVAFVVVAALVVVAGAIGASAHVAWVLHDEALGRARDAQRIAVSAVLAEHDAVAGLESVVADALAVRDAVDAQVLVHTDALGGAEALAPVTEARAALVASLVELFAVDEPTAGTAIPDAERLVVPGVVPEQEETAALEQLADELVELTDRARVTEQLHEGRSERLAELTAGLRSRLGSLASDVVAGYADLLASHPLASAAAQDAASGAVDALRDADADADLPALLDAYVGAATELVTSHEAESARRAAEEAASRAAAGRSRGGASGGGSGGGSGGSGGSAESVTPAYEQQGVLGETNAQRAANGLGALAWNGTLASRACAWAAHLASAGGELSHSGNSGGFSTWGENVAYGYGSASAVVAGWMGSTGHRANILRSSFTMMGACSSTSATGRIYWVQQFGG